VRRRQVEAYLYSRRNIVGCLLAVAGLALHFVGLLGGFLWLPITIGLYLIGVLLVPGEQGLVLQLGAAADSAQVRDGLDRLIRSLQGQVAADLIAKVVSIQASILRTLPAQGAEGDTADPNVYLIRQTALAYLPDAFQTYLKLPRQVAEQRPIADGRTPHDVLLSQLELMDQRLASVADDMARHDSDALLANGRFLADKFGVSSLRIDGDAVAATPRLPAHSSAIDPPSIPGTPAAQVADVAPIAPSHETGH
jgi:hypothetical protein